MVPFDISLFVTVIVLWFERTWKELNFLFQVSISEFPVFVCSTPSAAPYLPRNLFLWEGICWHEVGVLAVDFVVVSWRLFDDGGVWKVLGGGSWGSWYLRGALVGMD